MSNPNPVPAGAPREVSGEAPGQPKTPPHHTSTWQLIAPARQSMVVSFVVSALGAAASVVPYMALVALANDWVAGRGMARIWLWLGIALLGVLVHQICYNSAVGITHLSEARLRHLLRRRLVGQLQRLPLGQVRQLGPGEIRKIVVDDTSAIHTLVAHASAELTAALVSPLVGGIYLLVVDWRLTLLLVGGFTLISGVGMAWAFRGGQQASRDYLAANRKLAEATVELVDGIREIKNYQLPTTGAGGRFSQAREANSEASFRWLAGAGKGAVLVSTLIQPGVILAFSAPVVCWFVWSGWLSPANSLAFFTIWLGLPAGLGQLATLTQNLQGSLRAGEDTAALLDKQPQTEGTYQAHPRETAPELRFQDVSFAYQPGYPVLRDVSFTVPPGSFTALVGPSGGGKSTIAALAARFWDPDSGCITLGGRDLREYTFASLYGLVGTVFQEVSLATLSVRENLLLGNPKAVEAQVCEAARQAQIATRIQALPASYDTILGEEAVLSGGEAQRLTIARTLLAQPKLLILDEASAHQDSETAAALQETIAAQRRQASTLVIAHRLASVREADQILVIDGGQIVQAGRHTELAGIPGLYREMLQEQDVEC